MKKLKWHREKKILTLLPHKYFIIGVIASFLLFIGLVVIKFIGGYEAILLSLKNIFLLFMLMIVISKDKEEDEMTLQLRAQAFVFAFIFGVVSTTVRPLINIIANFFIESEQNRIQLSVSKLLFFMLLIQIAFYHGAKRMR